MRQPRSWRSTKQHVEGVHHRRRRPPHRAIEAEHGNAVHRVDEVRRLHHVVLLVAAQPCCGPNAAVRLISSSARERVERMSEVARHRSRMREQRHPRCRRAVFSAPARSGADQFRTASSVSANASGMVEVGLLRRMRERPVRPGAVARFDHRRESEREPRFGMSARQTLESDGGANLQHAGRFTRLHVGIECAIRRAAGLRDSARTRTPPTRRTERS